MFEINSSDGALAPLTSFGCGACVQLGFMSLQHDDAQRLRDLGLCEGTCCNIVQNSDKLILHVGGCRLGVQRELAMQLFAQEVGIQEAAG